MRKKRGVKVKARRRTLPKEIRELAKDPLFAGAKKPLERRQGHSALRLRDRRLEIFDPHPYTEATPETDAAEQPTDRIKGSYMVVKSEVARSLERRLRLARVEVKKGWDAFYALRKSVSERAWLGSDEFTRPK